MICIRKKLAEYSWDPISFSEVLFIAVIPVIPFSYQSPGLNSAHSSASKMSFKLSVLLGLVVQLQHGLAQNSCNSCAQSSPCCLQQQCCDAVTMACCNGYGCVPPCRSQFDVLPCSDNLDEDEEFLITNLTLANKANTCPNIAQTGKLYRVIRSEENCDRGLIAKNPSATRTVISHVNCGSRSGYTSQYISFTTSPDVTNKYKTRSGGRVVTVLTSQLPNDCNIFDLTVQANRDMYLGNAVCANFAKSDCEVLLECGSPIPCQITGDGDVFLSDDGGRVESYFIAMLYCIAASLFLQ